MDADQYEKCIERLERKLEEKHRLIIHMNQLIFGDEFLLGMKDCLDGYYTSLYSKKFEELSATLKEAGYEIVK